MQISRSALIVIAAIAAALPASAAHYRGHKTAHVKAHDALQAGPSDFVCKVTQAAAKKGAPKPKPQVTTRGLSLFDAVDQLGAYRGTIFDVESVPHGLAIQQRGSNRHHFEIVVTDCTATNHPGAVEFQKRLNHVVLKDVTSSHSHH